MTDAPNEALKLHRFLPYRLFVLASRVSNSLASHYEDQFDITRAEWRVIAVLGEVPDLSAAQVAERTAMDKVAVSRAVTKLIDSGRLQRIFSENDKRRSELRLSDSGRELYRQIVPIAQDYEQKILDQMSQDEIQLLIKLLDQLDSLNLEI